MRLYTSFALGLLAFAAGACSSDDADPPDTMLGGLPPVREVPNGSGDGNTSDPNTPDPNASGSGETPVGPGTDQTVDDLAPQQPDPSTDGSGNGDGEQTPPAEETPQEENPGNEMPPPEENPPPGEPRNLVFLLFGQSNMWGVPQPQQQDMEINPRVEVLTITACANHGANQWVPAQPPLHGCVGQINNNPTGPGVGPGDYFAKTLAEAFPQDTILLVPGAVPGVSIDTFQPGQGNYNNLLNRARMAQQRGEIAGMIFHQGETDTGQSTWPQRVATTVNQLRSDLGIGEVPFVAGELPPNGCCGNGHNPLINQLPNVISNTAVVSAQGFTLLTMAEDTQGNLHFNTPSQREFGRRYAAAMLELLGQ